MARTIEVEIEVGSKQALKSLNDLEQAQEQLLEQLKQTDIGTAEYSRLQKQLKQVGNQVKDLELGFESLDKEQRATALVDSFTGVAGAITAATGAFTLFGGESEELEEVEKRILGLIAVTSGLRDISNGLVAVNKLVGPSFTELGKSIKTAFTTGTTAAKTFRVALASIGIGILVAGITALVENFDSLKASLLGVADATALTGDELKTASQEAGKNIAEVEILTAKVQDQTIAEGERRKALNELQLKYPAYFENLGDDIENTDALKKSKDLLIDTLIRESKIRALGSKIEGEATKFAEQRLEALQEVRDQEAAQLERQQKLAKARAGEFVAFGLTQEQTIAGLQKDIQSGQTFIANARARSQEKITKINQDEEEAIKALTEAINIETKAIEKNGGATEEGNEGKDKSIKKTQEQIEAEKAAAKAKLEAAQKQNQAAAIAAEAEDEVAEITLSAREKEIEDVKDRYRDKLALLVEVYGIESDEVKKLTILQNKEISDINTKFDNEEANKQKEADKKKKDALKKAAEERAKVIEEISEATVVTEEQRRQKEIDDTIAYYDKLIEEAKKYGIDITALEKAKNDKLNEIRKDDREKRNEDIESVAGNIGEFADAAQDLIASVGNFYEKTAEVEQNKLKAQFEQGLITQEEYNAKSEKLNEKAFEQNKKVATASAIISTLSGALDAFTSTLKIDPTGILGTILATAALAAGFAQVDAIQSTNFESTNAPTTAAASFSSAGSTTLVGGTAGTSVPLSLNQQQTVTGTGQGQAQTGQVGGLTPQKLYVLAGDVTNAQQANTKIRQQRKL